MTIEARHAASATGSSRIEMQAIYSAVIWRSFRRHINRRVFGMVSLEPSGIARGRINPDHCPHFGVGCPPQL
jgi:hypothetical protein